MPGAILSSSVRRSSDKSRSGGTYFFLFGFGAVRLLPEADFAAAEGLVLDLALLDCGFDVDFEADFAGVEALAAVLGFAALAGALEADAAFAGAAGVLVVAALFVGDATLLAVDAVFAGTVVLAGTVALAGTDTLAGTVALTDTDTFAPTSVLTGFATSLGAGGFAGFFFGGSCNSAKRSMTSSIDCSESA